MDMRVSSADDSLACMWLSQLLLYCKNNRFWNNFKPHSTSIFTSILHEILVSYTAVARMSYVPVYNIIVHS